MTYEVSMNGTPVPVQKAGEFTKVKRWRNDQGHTIELAYFDHLDNPVENYQGMHRKKGVLSTRGFVEEVEFFDRNNERTRLPIGISKIKRRQGPMGRVEWQAYFDENDSPTALPDGEYGRRIRNDEHGRETYVEFLGPDGRMQDTSSGYAFYQNLWDIDEGQFQEKLEQVPTLGLKHVLGGANSTTSSRDGGVDHFLWNRRQADRRWYNEARQEVLPLLRITQLMEGSNALRSGLQVEDKIVHYSGQGVATVQALQWMIRHQDATTIEVIVLRDGALKPVDVENGPLGVALEEHYLPVDELQEVFK